MTVASPALHRAVLHTLGHAPVHRGAPISDTWAQLTGDLDDDEARALPDSLGLVLPLLAGDRERLRLAVDLAVTFDLYEAAAPLIRLLAADPDPDLILGAAALAANPATPAGALRRLREVAGDRLPDSRRRVFALRLDPAAPGATDMEQLLRAQQWPGAAEDARSPGPVVAVDAAAEPAAWTLRLLTRLHEAGASVRRIPPSAGHEVPAGWLGPTTPVVAASPTTIARLREWGQHVTGSQFLLLDTAGDLARSVPRRLGAVQVSSSPDERIAQVLRDIRDLLPPDQPLRPVAAPRLPVGVRPALEEGTFTLGAFTAREMAFLASSSGRKEVYRLGVELTELRPRKVEGFSYWRFNQVVALRTYHYLRQRTGRRIRADVIRALAEYGGRREQTQVAVTATGKVLEVGDDDEMHELESGQTVMGPVVRLDEVFQPFAVGAARTFPDLLEPGRHSRVHPAVLGGTPVVEDTRIPCKAVARLADDHGMDAVAEAYPSLSAPQASDAVRVGRQVLAVR